MINIKITSTTSGGIYFVLLTFDHRFLYNFFRKVEKVKFWFLKIDDVIFFKAISTKLWLSLLISIADMWCKFGAIWTKLWDEMCVNWPHIENWIFLKWPPCRYYSCDQYEISTISFVQRFSTIKDRFNNNSLEKCIKNSKTWYFWFHENPNFHDDVIIC